MEYQDTAPANTAVLEAEPATAPPKDIELSLEELDEILEVDVVNTIVQDPNQTF